MKAVMLLSGGLDSTLATRLMIEQGVELEALNFTSIFCNCTPKGSSCCAASKAVQGLGVRLKIENTSEEFLDLVRAPGHGYGSNLNPCIDCRIMMFRRAREYMREVGASFVVTGEVVGERPMSQRRAAMALIEREAGLDGLVVRPLCAAHLEPSLPEREGWVDRSRFLAIKGRSRKPQIELARKMGLKDYPCPAGGCLLTDPGFAARMRDLMEFEPAFTLADVRLLKYGRHFRLSAAAKAVVGRDEKENAALTSLRSGSDLIMEAADAPGPLTLVRGRVGEEERIEAARLTAYYGKSRAFPAARVIVRNSGGEPWSVIVSPTGAKAAATVSVGREEG